MKSGKLINLINILILCFINFMGDPSTYSFRGILMEKVEL